MREVDELVNQYAHADRSDTFASYNDAILLSKEILRLRKIIAKLKPKKPNRRKLS